MHNDESGSGSDIDSFAMGILERAKERRRLYSSVISSGPRASLTSRIARSRELKVDKEEEEEEEDLVVEKEEEVEEVADDEDEETSEGKSVSISPNSPKYARPIEANTKQDKFDRVKSEDLAPSSRRSSPGGRLSRLNALASNINSWEDDLTHFVSSKSCFNVSPKLANTNGRNSPTAATKSVLASNTSFSSGSNNVVRKSLLPVLGNQSVDGGGSRKKISSPNSCRILDLEPKKSPTPKVGTGASKLSFNKQSRQVEIITEKVAPNVWDKSILNSLEAQGFVANPTKTELTYEYNENAEPMRISSPKSSPQKGQDDIPGKLTSPSKPQTLTKSLSPLNSPVRTQVEIDTMETPHSKLSVVEKAALLESIPTSSLLIIEKDPTELTVAQRAKLFEKKAMIGNDNCNKPTTTGGGRPMRIGGKAKIVYSGRPEPAAAPVTRRTVRPSVSTTIPAGNVENRRRLLEAKMMGTLDSREEVVPRSPPTKSRQIREASSLAEKSHPSMSQTSATATMAPPPSPPMPITAVSGRSSVSPKKSSPVPPPSPAISPNRSSPRVRTRNNMSTPKRSVSPSSRSPSPKSKYPGSRDVKRIRVSDPKPGHLYPSLTDIDTETTETENEGEGDMDMVQDNMDLGGDEDMDSETSMLSGSSLGAQIEIMAKAKVEEYETPKPRRNPFHRRTEDFSASLACRQIDAYIDEALEGQDFTLDTVIESELNPHLSSTPKSNVIDETESQSETVWRLTEEISRRSSIDDTVKAEQSSVRLRSPTITTCTAVEAQSESDESPIVNCPVPILAPAPENDAMVPDDNHASKELPVASDQDSSCIIASSPLFSKIASPVGTPLVHTVSVYRKQQEKTMTLTPRFKLREENISPNEIPAPTPPTDKTSLNLMIAKLDEEVAHQQRSIGQISKALSLCKSKVEFSDSTENVECERILLIATQKRTALLNEIHRLKTEGVLSKMTAISPSKQDLSPTCRGTMTITNVEVPHNLKKATTATPTMDTVCHFICLARYRNHLEVSPLVSVSDGSTGGNVSFPNSFSFKHLEPEFEVRMDFYVLRSRKEFLPHEAKYHINTKEKTPKKSKDVQKLSRGYQASPAGPDAVRTSNFKLCGSLLLNISNLGQSSIRLEGCSSPLEGSAAVKIECSAEDGVEERGFLTVFDDVAGFGAWHRRWCTLTPTELISYMYPEDEQSKVTNPHTVITLRNCVTSNVKPVGREICARANTFMLVMSRPRRDTDKESLVTVCEGRNTYVKHLISADSKDERDLWCQKLNRALANMRAWDPQCYSGKDSASTSSCY